jgi:hypothetical protein
VKQHIHVASGLPLLRGAIPTPRHRLARATPFRQTKAVLPSCYFAFPGQMNIWGNSQYGDCCSAGEAFNKAVGGIFVSEPDVIRWARNNGVLNGAGIEQVITLMSQAGMPSGAGIYGDGADPSAVDWTDASLLQEAIFAAGSASPAGSVKLGVAADQLPSGAGNTNGWFLVGASPENESAEDHCMEYCGYGSAAQFVAAINQIYGTNITVPGGVDPTTQGYAAFTWATIGFFDLVTNRSIVFEAWLRDIDTTVQTAGVPVADLVTVVSS